MKKLFTLLTLLFVLCAYQTARAVETKTVINVVKKNAKVLRFSTLYIGEVVLDGEQSFCYLYSEDLTNSEDMFWAVHNGLNVLEDKKFGALVPVIVGATDDKGVAVCSNSDYSSIMNSDWKDASKAGQACLTNTSVSSSSSENLYETDADFATRCGTVNGEVNVYLVDEVGYDFTSTGLLGKLSATNTDNVTYTVIDGVLVKLIDRTIDYTCEMVTVIFTRAELETNSSGVKATLSDNGGTKIVGWYSLDGKQLSQPQKGVNLQKNSDGTITKVIK